MSLLWDRYGLQQKQVVRPRAEMTGTRLLKFWLKCAAVGIFVWLLLCVWPALERVSR